MKVIYLLITGYFFKENIYLLSTLVLLITYYFS